MSWRGRVRLSQVYDFRIRFSAINPSPLPEEAATQLAAALTDMPGPELVGEASHTADERRVDAEFVVKVRHGMADAARDGSRLAKEGLKSASLPDATLVDLQVTRESPLE